jgi:hypothetical protein
MYSVFQELAQVPYLFSWSIVLPIFTAIVMKFVRFMSYYFPRLRHSIESGKVKLCSQILAGILLCILSITKNFVNRESSIFSTHCVYGCNDPSIKVKYKSFVKASHPDKNDSPNLEFSRVKAMFEVLKSHHKCQAYDVFGVDSDDLQKISRSEKESLDHYIIES